MDFELKTIMQLSLVAALAIGFGPAVYVGVRRSKSLDHKLKSLLPSGSKPVWRCRVRTEHFRHHLAYVTTNDDEFFLAWDRTPEYFVNEPSENRLALVVFPRESITRVTDIGGVVELHHQDPGHESPLILVPHRLKRFRAFFDFLNSV